MHPTALFILGHAGVGKSHLTSRFVCQQRMQQRAWCVLDKDVVSECWSGPLLQALGFDPHDRDSPAFKAHVRDLGYQSTLRIARDQLELGLDVILPGPWNRELASGALFESRALGLPPPTQLRHVWMELPAPVRRQRIILRGDPRDQWKLAHWDDYIAALRQPDAVVQGTIPVLDASLPLDAQLAMLQALVA
ncbi:ATP-binding protein [Allopusillimonas soli]|uniref:AAA family ATPase n=1 Tax=Allopusillimonas soli TaxID=659016 RepID=A0A853F856_9BURK|nr:AAA family ATPase [Allopusillimonas soli]NYT36814.1 AAA family ATPase [Allopusillimonas soli]TEA75278.1 ATP-binding protein [Allopusillimonas soli]